MNEVFLGSGSATSEFSARGVKVMSVFGTRPDLIKFLPVLRELHRRDGVDAVNVLTSQHSHLITPLLDPGASPSITTFRPCVHGQSLNELMARIQSRMDRVFSPRRRTSFWCRVTRQARWRRHLLPGIAASRSGISRPGCAPAPARLPFPKRRTGGW